MHDFLIKEVINSDLIHEINDIGYDISYTNKAVNKFIHKNFKIFSVTSAQANIIKQTALSTGADCATNKKCILGDADLSDCILGGNITQIEIIANKLTKQPFGLKELGEKLLNAINETKINKKTSTQIVAILNVTPDSFSDGGQFLNPDKAFKRIDEIIAQGADIIDIGAESTRPESEPVDDATQICRLLPVVKYSKDKGLTVSVDTRSSQVAKEMLSIGADIINDVSGLEYDKNMANTIAQYNAKVIIQHSKGTPKDMQNNPSYNNLMDEIYISLHKKINYAQENGIDKKNIIIDPGIGFGKTRENNFEIIRRIEELNSLQCPIMLGISRKSLLNMKDFDNNTKDIYTVALNTLAIQRKVNYLRVHNVKLHRQLIDLTSEIVL